MSTPLTIMITGAGTGFGRGAADTLAARGHRVIAAVHDETQAEAVRTALGEEADLEVLVLDLERPEQIRAAAEREIDVLVNNAGFGSQGPIGESALPLVRRAFEVNVFGPLDLTQQVLARMRIRGRGGRIVFVSSVAGLFVGPGAGAYTMSKHALDAMAVELQQEVAGSDIAVHILNPGPYQTGFNERLVENAPSDADQHQRLLSSQSDPAEAIALLAGLADGSVAEPRVITPARFAEVITSARAAYTGVS